VSAGQEPAGQEPAGHLPRTAWQPPAREMARGHRISLEPGWRPIETRRYPAWWWPFELVNRLQARLSRHLSGELRRGLERVP
jgi:hypothetical protein